MADLSLITEAVWREAQRPPALTPDQVALGCRLVDEGTSVRAAAKVLRCHHATLYRALDAAAAAGHGLV